MCWRPNISSAQSLSLKNKLVPTFNLDSSSFNHEATVFGSGNTPTELNQYQSLPSTASWSELYGLLTPNTQTQLPTQADPTHTLITAMCVHSLPQFTWRLDLSIFCLRCKSSPSPGGLSANQFAWLLDTAGRQCVSSNLGQVPRMEVVPCACL